MESIKSFVLLASLQFLLSGSAAKAAGHEWPKVIPQKQYVIVDNNTIKAAAFFIFGTDGVPKYLIECHDSEYQGDAAFDYSGDFECRLTSLYSKDAYSTLFTDDPNQSRDWQSRARFLVGDLFGSCASDRSYGPVRRFRLRGMQISLTMTNIRTRILRDTAKGETKRARQLSSFAFAVAVTPDSAITSEISEPVKTKCAPL
jgi:hypothetical protein